MPGRDQTGPLGTGPASGRGMGYCGKDRKARISDFCFRRRFGRGSGFGYHGGGFRGGIQSVEYSPPGSSAPLAERETSALKDDLRRVDGILQNIKSRIASSENGD